MWRRSFAPGDVSEFGARVRRLEAMCATVVEGTFALAFPTALEPVQIARKLVAAYEAQTAPGRAGRRFLLRLHPRDAARLAGDLATLEPQWRAMLGRLGEREARHEPPPEIATTIDPAVARGTVAIDVSALAPTMRLALRVRRGLPLAVRTLDGPLVVGRGAECDLALVDPRVSRRHLALEPQPGGGTAFRDLGSANGTLHNGRAATSGLLANGDVLALGDSELAIEAAP